MAIGHEFLSKKITNCIFLIDIAQKTCVLPYLYLLPAVIPRSRKTIATPIRKPKLYWLPLLYTSYICIFGLIKDNTRITGEMIPCQIPCKIPATRLLASALLTSGFEPGTLISNLKAGTEIWPLGVGVPAGMIGAGVLICIVEPGAQPASNTTIMAINEKLIIFLINWYLRFFLRSYFFMSLIWFVNLIWSEFKDSRIAENYPAWGEKTPICWMLKIRLFFENPDRRELTNDNHYDEAGIGIPAIKKFGFFLVPANLTLPSYA